ncbi:MAG: hypothetical protein U5K30_00090 [Acidimicrobiales bacterium]|nr:hypothetical protein [Acidimicrobiales bacterium]
MTAPPPHPHVSSPRRRLLIVVVLALALALLAEGMVRWLEPSLPRPAGWPDEATATKVSQLEAREDRGCTDVVFVGNSMTRDDLVPSVFHQADPAGRDAYNAALDAASPELLQRWVRDEVLPRTQPATVVIGIASFDLNDAASAPEAALRAYDGAPYTASGLAGSIEAAFTRALALVRNRDSLRDPETVIEGIADRVAGRDAPRPSPGGIPGVIAADGHGLSRRDLTFTGAQSTITRLRQQFLDPFELGGDQAAALRGLVDEVAVSGAQAVVLSLPVTDAYLRAHPDGLDDVRAYDALLEDTLEGTEAVLVDSPDLPRTAFADTHHLAGTGADALSAELPGLLADAGVSDRACGAP